MSQRFEYDFRSRYARIDGVNLHYIDEGDGPVIWLMHGMPMWSYVYRKLVPPLVEAGYRCFVPDLMGFGLSDKPQQESAHDLRRHVQLMSKLVDTLGLEDITVLGQDWGGPIVLRYAMENQHNVAGMVLLNTFIQRFPKNQSERLKYNIITGPLPKVYELLFKSGWLSSILVNRLDVFRQFVWLRWKTGNGMQSGAGFRRPVDPRAMENYRQPNNRPGSRTAIAAFAKAIPNRADHPNAQYIDDIAVFLKQTQLPARVIFPDGDMAWRPQEGECIARLIPGADFHLVDNAGHYLQEDAGEELVPLIAEFMGVIYAGKQMA